MGNNRRSHNQQRPSHPHRKAYAPPPVATAPPAEKKPPVEYGKPFTLLEDENKMTFEFNHGTWVPYEMTIAQCRQNFQVKELPQKVNRMTRYEVRRPIGA